MKPPSWFERSLQNYDHLLRVRWRAPMNCFAVERAMEGTPPDKRVALKEVFWDRATRPIRPGLTVALVRAAMARRSDARARLDALNEDHRVIFFVPDTSDTTLQLAHRSLKETDLWQQSGYGRRSIDDAANSIHDDMTYEQDRAEEREAATRRDNNRYRAFDVYNRLQWKTGATVANPLGGA